ncbi:MAG TPA: hypothetical protein VF474_12870 [Phenylobacterium sp.]
MSHPYATDAYARSLGHVGRPFAVPEWGCEVLLRDTPCGTRRDAVGTYPLAALDPAADLPGGLERLRAAGLVSVVLVTDDRLRPPLEDLQQAFGAVRRFKAHFLYDRTLGPQAYDKHHRYEIRRATGRVEAREIVLAEHLASWEALYGELSARHALGGLHAFPLAHHAALARLPGLRAFGAFMEGGLVSAHLFVTDAGYAVSHLAASSPEGYRNGAAYAVNALAVEALTDCGVINFGGGAGAGEDPADGLIRFKKGFSNRIAASWLCGAVLDADAYQALSAGAEDNGFFPAYRGKPRDGAMR